MLARASCHKYAVAIQDEPVATQNESVAIQTNFLLNNKLF